MRKRAGHSPRTVRKGRDAIVTTFNALVLNGRYAELGVRELARKAGVARSTFYEHFDDKTALLIESMYPLLSVLAECAAGEYAQHLAWVLAHMEEQRTNALALFYAQQERNAIEAGLARLISEKLPRNGIALPISDAAAVLARTSIGMIADWLARERRATNLDFASILRNALHALKASICA